MRYFAEKLTKPMIRKQGFKKLLEIGASYGKHADCLLELEDINLTIIDPCIDCGLVEKYKDNNRVKVLKGLSIETLAHLRETFDCIFLDGDHNWYTVTNELKLIEKNEILKDSGVIFCHDVGWPYGRRDMSYVPDKVPQEFQQPYKKLGIIRGQSALADQGGLNATLFNADHEGGERNGVVSGIEDFLKESAQSYTFFCDYRQYGMGIIIKSQKKAALLLRLKTWLRNRLIFIKRRFKAIANLTRFEVNK